MYNHTHLEQFMEKVTAEAEQAAQEIFDRYTPELERRIKAQMKNGHTILVGMGTACIAPDEDLPNGYADKFLRLISATQYAVLKSNFNLSNITKE